MPTERAAENRIGAVYLVGAGPGDPKLITLAGKEALERADVVIYDRLANPRLLQHAAPGAELIFAGKGAGRHTMTQDEINACLAERALAGKTVVRLKGGDPFVFGRGGEEAEYLRERGISYVVVPGVTSAIAAPAYAGIPITHRDDSSSFAVITGHERDDSRESGGRAPGESEQRRRWDRIAHAADTLVLLMGVESIGEISQRLIEHGRAASTPVAMVRWGSWSGKQETLVGTLADIAVRVEEAGFKAPAVTVVGDVVRWRERLRWWDNRPLSGRRIVVTRAREQASALVERLEELGAEAVEFPAIRTQPPARGYAALDRAVGNLLSFEWLIFTSGSAVEAFFERLAAMRKDTRALGHLKVAAVGPATAERLRQQGIHADFLPDESTGEEIARQLSDEIVQRGRFLFPRAVEANETISDVLISRGAKVEIVPAYETVPDTGNVELVRERLTEGSIDAITFTSSSTVKNFAAAFGPIPPPIAGVTVACIGPSTAQTARELFQREPDIIARDHTVPGLIEALEDHWREQ